MFSCLNYLIIPVTYKILTHKNCSEFFFYARINHGKLLLNDNRTKTKANLVTSIFYSYSFSYNHFLREFWWVFLDGTVHINVRSQGENARTWLLWQQRSREQPDVFHRPLPGQPWTSAPPDLHLDGSGQRDRMC